MLAQRPRNVVAVYQEIFRALRRGDTVAARDLRARAKAQEKGLGREMKHGKMVKGEHFDISLRTSAPMIWT